MKLLLSLVTAAALMLAGCQPQAVEPAAHTAQQAGQDRVGQESRARVLHDDGSDEPARRLRQKAIDELAPADHLAEVRPAVTTGDRKPTAARPKTQVQVNEALAASANIRQLTGKHLTLYTDLPSHADIDELPEVFDQAVPLWCRYFRIDPLKTANWHMTGYMLKDAERFRSVGLLPDSLPPFAYGYQRGNEFWVYDQPSMYYRRHLMLHEGTHGFMNHWLGSTGPPWYMEGVAELLGTHRWNEGVLMLAYTPSHKDEVPYWGRIKIVQDAFRQGRTMNLTEVLGMRPGQFRESTEPYAWSWAAAALLDGHPHYRERFRDAQSLVSDAEFTQKFLDNLGQDRSRLWDEWQLLVRNIQYGYDLEREAVAYAPATPLNGTRSVTVVADRGWQSSGVELVSGTSYRIIAEGRYQIARQPMTWWCEPGGVTIRYHQGQPLGKLLATVRPDPSDRVAIPWEDPIPIGLEHTITPNQTGALYLRVNDSPSELADNEGTLTVKVGEE